MTRLPDLIIIYFLYIMQSLKFLKFLKDFGRLISFNAFQIYSGKYMVTKRHLYDLAVTLFLKKEIFLFPQLIVLKDPKFS